MSDFLEWIDQELASRGWKYSELARRANITRNAVSAVMNGRNNVTWDFCYNIAQGLEMSPVEVFKKAGLLTSDEAEASKTVEVLSVQFMTQLADMLGMTPLDLFRQLGLLGPLPEASPTPSPDELTALIAQLPPDKKSEVLNYVKYQLQK